MKDKEKIMRELLKIVEADSITPEVVSKLFKFSRIQSSLNEKLLAKETSKVRMRDTLSKIINPFYLKPEEAGQLSMGEIEIGVTPEGYVVGLDVEREFLIVISGKTGSGKSRLLAKILMGLDSLNENRNQICRRLA